jgi:transposase
MKFYGIDLHYDSFIAAIIDENNQMTTRKISLHLKEFREFLKELSEYDYIAVEASTNSFWFYDQVIGLVEECFIINPSKFLEIYKTNKKTDKIDAKKIAKKLRYRILSDGDEDDLPTVYVPTHEVRELRSLFSTYKILIKQKTMLKNRIHSLLIQQGYYLKDMDIFHKDVREAAFNLELPETTVFQLEVLYKQVDFLEGQVNEVKEKILEKGKPFENEIDKLVSIKGVSVFIAIAIMTDIADIKRFNSSKKLCSYLRSAPKIDASNKSEKIGCVNKCSRSLSIGMLLQGLMHIYNSSEYLHNFYKSKRGRRAGKVRVAIARKTFTYIYQMLKKDEYFRWMDIKNHARKMNEYRSFLGRKGSEVEMKKSA